MIAQGAGKNPNNPSDPGWDATLERETWLRLRRRSTAAFKCSTTYQTWTRCGGQRGGRELTHQLHRLVRSGGLLHLGRRAPPDGSGVELRGGRRDASSGTYPWGSHRPGLHVRELLRGSRRDGLLRLAWDGRRQPGWGRVTERGRAVWAGGPCRQRLGVGAGLVRHSLHKSMQQLRLHDSFLLPGGPGWLLRQLCLALALLLPRLRHPVGPRRQRRRSLREDPLAGKRGMNFALAFNVPNTPDS